MRAFLLFIVLSFLSNLILAQPFCQDQKQHFHRENSRHKNQFKSGDEALRSDTINVLNYDIALDFTNADLGTLKGNCEVKFSPFMNVTSLSLDLLELTVDSVVMNNNPLAFSYDDTLLIAFFGSTISAGATDSLTVYYHGSPQMDPSGWGGYYMTGGYYFNLGVGFESLPHNFGRVWHPCFDNFVERATYQFTTLTDNGNTAYCNGTRTSVTTVGTDSLLTVWKLNTEIPSYLASFAVTNYTHLSQIYTSVLQGIDIPMWLAARPSDTTNLKNSFIHLVDAMAAFENYFGTYNWERVGFVLVPFSSGAMEHATNIAYPLATANGTLTYETLMAHELSHHWWGDWVTCTTAEEMWINEGLASYSERLFLEWVYGYADYMTEMRSNHYDVLHLAHINDDGYYALNAVPLQYTYGDHSYNKGSDVMHTLRGYLGDANFFAGLKAVQTQFGGGNVSSSEFMQAMNTISGVDVTDFFNAWIFQPGFAHFSISNYTVTPTGANYNVQVLVDQKLKGGADFHDNVPLQLTFMDANWNIHTEQIILSTSYQVFNFTLPINPVFVGVNLDEKINDATTAQDDIINDTGTLLWNYANVRFAITNIVDSAFVRIEHNWVYPDVVNVPANVQISKERYWNVHGVDLQNVTGTLRFEFNGKLIPSGYMDTELLVDLGNQNFIEDSVVLLYRPDAQSSWQIHSDYTVNYLGSHTDMFGNITTNYFAGGQYTFGYRTNTVGINDEKKSDKTYSIYPNPASDSMNIDLRNWDEESLNLEIYGLEGKLAFQKKIKGGENNLVLLETLGNGTYLVLIKNKEGIALGSKRVVVSR